MIRKHLLLSAALIVAATTAQAQINPQALADAYVAQGYSRVEVTVGPTDVKVEAISGATELEVIYDRATGAILSRESGPASLSDMRASGVEVRSRDRDALRGDDSARADDDDDDDSGRGRGRGRGSDDGDGDRGERGRGSDDGDGDRGGRGRGSDDGDGDRGSDDAGRDRGSDDGDGDRGGRGRGSDD